MQNLRDVAERQSSTVFHAMWPEMLASEGFGKNLQQNLIRLIFFNSFPQLVHKLQNRHDNRGNREKARNEALTKVTSEALRGTKLRRSISEMTYLEQTSCKIDV